MLEFGLTKKKVEKVEKYPEQAVLTYLGGEKVSNFQFNKKALELMGYEGKGRKVSFGFFDDYIFVANTSDIKTKDQNNITAKDYFANSLLVKKIKAEYDIDLRAEYEFPLLTPDEPSEGTPYLLLSKSSVGLLEELGEVVSDTVDSKSEVASEEEEVHEAQKDDYDFYREYDNDSAQCLAAEASANQGSGFER